jgi:hypothetical protein
VASTAAPDGLAPSELKVPSYTPPPTAPQPPTGSPRRSSRFPATPRPQSPRGSPRKARALPQINPPRKACCRTPRSHRTRSVPLRTATAGRTSRAPSDLAFHARLMDLALQAANAHEPFLNSHSAGFTFPSWRMADGGWWVASAACSYRTAPAVPLQMQIESR